VICHNLRSEHHTDNEDWFQFIDIITDHVDLVVNPTYGSFCSSYIRQELEDLGLSNQIDFVDGDVTPNNVQWITAVFRDREDVAKIRLLTHDLNMSHHSPYYLLTKGDLPCHTT